MYFMYGSPFSAMVGVKALPPTTNIKWSNLILLLRRDVYTKNFGLKQVYSNQSSLLWLIHPNQPLWLLCGSRKYPHCPRRVCWVAHAPPPLPPQKSNLGSYFSLKAFAFAIRLPLWITINDPWNCTFWFQYQVLNPSLYIFEFHNSLKKLIINLNMLLPNGSKYLSSMVLSPL